MKITYISVLLLFLFQASIVAKTALITGITGQDGSYLAEFLLEKGYEVHGLIRYTSRLNIDLIKNLVNPENPLVTLHYGELTDPISITNLIEKVQPDEIYNLAAQSHVQRSFEAPTYTAIANSVGALCILEAIRKLNLQQKVKFYQASTSEMFGKVQEIPQKETTSFYPRSPYGISKLSAHWTTVNYRESYNVFACSGILFNHESPRRGKDFVTRKITCAIARIKNGSTEPISLGNLDAKRDWGYAKDYVEAMWAILQQEQPEDYVIATGETHTVREFIEEAFKVAGIDIAWQGSGLDEIGINKANGNILVKINPEFFRPSEVDLLIGDCTKAKEKLGWKSKTTFKELVKLMVESDLAVK